MHIKYLDASQHSCTIICQKLILNLPGAVPRQQFDHGTMVFHCQPWLTMVDCDTTVVSDHGPNCPLTMVHGQPWSENVIVDIERTCLENGT